MQDMQFDHHISQQFNAALGELRSHLMEMGGMVEKQLTDAVNSLEFADSALAAEVLRVEDKIDELDVSIDEECTRILARRQPTASDLRMVLAVSRTVRDLERIGDECSKVAKMAIMLAEEGESPRGYREIRHISTLVKEMLSRALDAFARFDAVQAVEVVREDKEVDREYGSAMRELITYMMEDPRSITRVMHVIWALRSLERVGDHARNVAEHVIYLVKGKDVRHRSLQEMEDEINNDK